MDANQLNDLEVKRAVLSATEVLVKESQRKVEIVDIITRANSPSLFVVAYRDLNSKNHYLFYKDELIFPNKQRYKPAA